ncbi:NADH-quinone oxidoreductase subunit L [Candidatus Microthrix sp.]|uniref:NADH-quinone oxidoreductase subunit 5 family protein n=1 Tax=Candidatus Neomicrothrix sp. TaxID=2719034 RepID=UPI0025BEB59F|nr:proton-conducting transporter membrane subunit [Candidatus Microthrix sp.]
MPPWPTRSSPWVGAATALFAATVAVAQNDIKKVLAYSTVSQLGYMFLAVGTGAYVAAIFHMVTHAFFKALLFLGAGSVIHSLNGDQDMRRMGGLRKYLPITSTTFIIGWLAIAGVPPFSGFWSKDDILLCWSLTQGPVLWAIGLLTALLTAFYMTRQVILVFFGPERFRPKPSRQPLPSPPRWAPPMRAPPKAPRPQRQAFLRPSRPLLGLRSELMPSGAWCQSPSRAPKASASAQTRIHMSRRH